MHTPSPMIGRDATAKRPGYILLISILAIGGIASAVLTSLLLLGTSAARVSLSIQQSNQALSTAQACAEYALLNLRTSASYGGDATIALTNGQCTISPIGGAGYSNRSICVQGESGDAVRRMEILVNQVVPVTTITSWQEVGTFTLCP